MGRNATRLNIRSRFARDDASDYFLHYMLGRVFDANMLDFDQSAGGLGMIDYLDCLFPCCLRRAWAQGVYRAYVGRQCNDAGVKGRIDMARHLRTNMPFRGSVAYTMREYSADNSLMQLVRHTIEHLKAKPLARALLAADSQTRSIIDTVCHITRPTYSPRGLRRVVEANLKPLSHPFFTGYRTLQRLSDVCMVTEHRFRTHLVVLHLELVELINVICFQVAKAKALCRKPRANAIVNLTVILLVG